MLKCPASEAFRFAHILHIPSGVCLLCDALVLEPLEWSALYPPAQIGATEVLEGANVPKAIPLTNIFPGLSPAWADPAPILPPLEYITVKTPKPTGVTKITPGDNANKTADSVDLLSLHFPLEEASGQMEDSAEAGSGATANQVAPE